MRKISFWIKKKIAQIQQNIENKRLKNHFWSRVKRINEIQLSQNKTISERRQSEIIQSLANHYQYCKNNNRNEYTYVCYACSKQEVAEVCNILGFNYSISSTKNVVVIYFNN